FCPRLCKSLGKVALLPHRKSSSRLHSSRIRTSRLRRFRRLTGYSLLHHKLHSYK
ncbi:hypothetical protein ACJX0J_021377, partial [Zea mays]